MMVIRDLESLRLRYVIIQKMKYEGKFLSYAKMPFHFNAFSSCLYSDEYLYLHSHIAEYS